MFKMEYHPFFVIIISTLLLSLLALTSVTFASDSRKKQTNHISYSDVGRGEPLVLIHAYPLDKRLWKPQQDSLAQHFRVITLDLWGFGQSTAGQGQVISMDNYANEIKQLLDLLHIKKAIIGGESMGGYVSLAFLKHYPERVKGLILSDTNSISLNQQQKESYYQTANDILAKGSNNFIQGFLPKAVSKNASQQTRNYLFKIMNEQAPAAMAAAFKGIADRSNTSTVLNESSIPVLIITGQEDQVLPPQQSSDMHHLARNSRLIVISGAGHLSNLEKPTEWNRAVIDMFYSHS